MGEWSAVVFWLVSLMLWFAAFGMSSVSADASPTPAMGVGSGGGL